MSHLRHSLIACLLAGVLSSGCSEKVTDHVLVSASPTAADDDASEETTDDLTGNFSQKIRAEKLIVSAEALMSPIGFFFADEILDQALKADPNNRMGQFYKALLAPMMKLRGIITRIDQSPLHIRAEFGDITRYRHVLGGFKEFLNEPGPAFQDEESVRKFIEEVYVEQGKIVDFIKKNKNFVGKVAVARVFDNQSMLNGCSIERTAPLTYRIGTCPYLTFTSQRVNRGDWEAILQMANGYRVLSSMTASYDLPDYFKFREAQRNKLFKNAKQTFTALRAIPGFGKIRAANLIGGNMATASDIHQGLQWLVAMQGYFCGGNLRKEHLFQSKALCFKLDETDAQNDFSMRGMLDVIGLSLTGNGGTLEFSKTKTGHIDRQEISSVKLDVAAPIKRPVADLKTLMPVSFDRCGQAIQYEDKTFGGIFLDGNAREFIMAKRKTCGPRH